MAEESKPESKPKSEGDKKGPGGVSRKTWLIGGAVVGIVLYLWYRNKQAAASNAANLVGGINPASMPSGASSNTTSPPPATFTSLQGWMTAVQTWATMFDAGAVQNALQAYANGQCLTSDQFNIIDKALQQFGMPPDAPYQGLVQCPNQPPPPPPTPTPVIPPNSFFSLSLAAAKNFLAHGMQAYQSGAEAIAFAKAHGQSTTGIDPNAYYAVSPQSAQTLLAEGQPIYQSSAEAQQWQGSH